MSNYRIDYSDDLVDYMLDVLFSPNREIYGKMSDTLDALEREVGNKENFNKLYDIIENFASRKLHEFSESSDKSVFIVDLNEKIAETTDNKVQDLIKVLLSLIFQYNGYKVSFQGDPIKLRVEK